MWQVFHKQLTLASTASQASDFGHWHNLIISTAGVSLLFLVVIVIVSRRRPFSVEVCLEEGLYRSGPARKLLVYKANCEFFSGQLSIFMIPTEPQLLRGGAEIKRAGLSRYIQVVCFVIYAKIFGRHSFF